MPILRLPSSPTSVEEKLITSDSLGIRGSHQGVLDNRAE
ncbi:hypothetical protein NOCARDAX2BIS_250032 [Nocardioides sp. AX2bis]|nr:hypothetical protein NOCARDAX2BIS_250032 [Nocardioides sp. AX2bis]